MNTQCDIQTCFSFRHERQICVDFKGGQISSDAGLIAVREFDQRSGFTQSIVKCLHDARHPSYVTHGLRQMVLQRLYGSVAGYEDQNDADKGIDGQLIFFDDEATGEAKRIVISVKSGHVTVKDIRKLKEVARTQKAQIGAFITLQPPSGPMKTAAAEAGFYDPPGLLPEVPRLQILTVEELLAGKKLEYPVSRGGTFQKAPRQIKAKPKGRPSEEDSQ